MKLLQMIFELAFVNLIKLRQHMRERKLVLCECKPQFVRKNYDYMAMKMECDEDRRHSSA